ncbi:bifunctional glycosyltransferase/CDP-glycerol:glycerophosphate glycerophosphotransferase [Glutamicibacter arilaitensis]|uniref:Glycosyltransferase 2-like domain-containing protein n=1 Tax=Glutamicibacter arilaitensis TaxID=256701 RepID=A0A2N7S4Q2_9MICC|nr:CDP-glycerol glycerophosphotransferase family protein [Glutamicibacter arilaitensis]PMQ21125.1 hypothetical protein CIK84_06005 [Glutamicibacter arilaitensis]
MVIRNVPVSNRTTGSPDITIVLAHYNDGDHVVDAIRSVYGQTYRNIELILVDDCSTDGSATIAQKAVQLDARGQFMTLEKNSGGVGGPRRRGLELANGRYVLFLDSDDRLDRHACKNLLAEATLNDADIVMAKTKRFEIGSKKWRGWHDRLFAENSFYESIEDNPDLAVDTIVVAKLYRIDFLRKNGIQFPTDIHYEDLVFSATSFANARGISVIPESAYIWNIYPNEIRKSITNQRDSIRNLQHRIEALRRAFYSIDSKETPGLFARLQLKVLRHDARLYLNDIRHHTDEFSADILQLLRPFLSEIPEAIYDRLDQPERFLYGAALSLDVNGVREVQKMIRNRATWLPPLVLDSASKNYRWLVDNAATSDGQDLVTKLLTVQSAQVGSVPWFQVRWYHEVQEVTVSGNNLLINAHSFDPGAKLEGLKDLKVRVHLFARGKAGFSTNFIASNVKHDGTWLHWNVAVALSEHVDYSNISKFGMRVRLSNSLASTEGHLSVPRELNIPKKRINGGGPFSILLSNRYRPYRTIDDTLGLKRLKSGNARKALRRIVAPLDELLLKFSQVLNTPAKVNSKFWRTAYRAMRLLPLRENSSLFESHMGKSYADSPRVISDELSAQFKDQKQIWSFANGFDDLDSVPHQTIVRHSPRYLYELARSGYLVDNQSFPSYFKKRSGQRYLQLWHGIPLKKMGLDEPDFLNAPKRKRVELLNRSSYWDFLTVPSPYFEDTFVPAFDYTNELLRYGSPRNDSLVSLEPSEVTRLRRDLGLRSDQKIVLYAPTFRASSRGSRQPIRLELDLENWLESMGEECVLLVRAHYLNKINIHPRFFGKVIDVSSIPEIANLYALSDVLVTDYSSVMFDFLTVDKPIVIYAYDYERYVDDERGTYFSLLDDSPGQVVKSQDELHNSLKERLYVDHDQAKRHAFEGRYAGHEDGNAGSNTVARVWGDR